MVRSDGGPRNDVAKSEQQSQRPGDTPDATDPAAEDDAGSLTVEDHPDGTTDPADLAGSGGSGDDAVE